MVDSAMADVGLQRLFEAEYAFVIHTVNPATGDSTEMYAEVL